MLICHFSHTVSTQLSHYFYTTISGYYQLTLLFDGCKMIANMVSNASAIKTLAVCMWSHLSVSSDESHETRECRFSRQDETECAFLTSKLECWCTRY